YGHKDQAVYDKKEQIREASRKLAEAGIRFLYHNHWFEANVAGGEVVFDTLLREIGLEHIGPQPDVAWLQLGGVNPVDFIRKYRGHVPTVHLKDYDGVRDAVWAHSCACGEGLLDMPLIVKTAIECGAEYLIVEIDPAGRADLMDDVRRSIENLKRMT
ncbi:MAG: TIM barrel protein, partial [Clostridia bacterium]|nr:TIM barrel protein [Clostridia bacterium]